MASSAIDPLNLIRAMPAKGRIEAVFSAKTGPQAPRQRETKNTGSIDPTKSDIKLVRSPQHEVLRVKILAETAGLVALSGALYAIKVFTLPEGGSITLGSMVPIFLLALRRGPRIGIMGGAAFGLVALVEDQFIYYPAQVLLDYPLAFGALGLSGFFHKQPVFGVIAATGTRFLAHFTSGILFFASFAPSGMSPAVYSAIYNGSFLLPEMVISAIIIATLVKFKALELYI